MNNSLRQSSATNLPLITQNSTSMSQNRTRLCDFDANFLHSDLNITTHLQEAVQHNVQYFVVPASTIIESYQLIELKKQYSKNIIGITAGVHPYQTRETLHNDENLSLLDDLLLRNDSVAVVRMF